MTRRIVSKSNKEPKEDQEQIKLVTWLKNKGIRVSASANGGSRNLFEAMKLKRMGVSSGFPDIEIPLPVPGYHGLYIEMKRKKGSKVSDNQIEWLTYLRERGYYAEVAYGFDEAKQIVEYYLSLSLPLPAS